MTLKDSPNPSELEIFSVEDLNAYGLRRWRRVQHLSDQFYRRWRDFYLASLQKRSKWFKKRPNLEIGDLVLVKDKLTPRNYWKMGVIDSVVMSKDNVVRSCYVRYDNSVYRRAVSDLIFLQGHSHSARECPAKQECQ